MALTEDRQARREARDRHSGLVAGLVLITLGAIFTLDQMRWGFGWRMSELWPLIVIVVGVAQVMKGRSGGRFCTSGLWTIGIGVLFLLDTTRVMRFHTTWPLFIVGAGLALIFGSPRRFRRAVEENGDHHE